MGPRFETHVDVGARRSASGDASLEAWFTSAQLATLATAADTILPADDYPSATAAGVLAYYSAQFAGELTGRLPEYRLGLDALDAEAQAGYEQPFCDLSAEDAHRLLASVEVGAVRTVWPIKPETFIDDVINHVMEGFYGDPRNGGNHDAISWRMIGFEVTD
jgi:hypothetical protein